MKTTYIKDLLKNLIISDETFAIVECSKSEDKNGKTYYSLILGDKTGKIGAKIWSDTLPKINPKALKEGVIVKISAKTDEFKGTLQLNIMTLERVDEEALDDYMNSSEFSPDDMMQELKEEIKSIKDKSIKSVVEDILNDEEISKRLKYWPAANTIHHDFRSGLLQHVLEMFCVAKGLERFYPDVNFDILKAGIILHDLGKIYEMDGNNLSIPYTKEGTLLGHIYMGSRLFEKFAKDKLNGDVYLHILHLILSHHGTHAYGSPVLPATVEAIMLTYIDNVSAKSRTADSVRKSISDEEEFSKRVLWLENAKIWKFTNLLNNDIESGKDDSHAKDQISLV